MQPARGAAAISLLRPRLALVMDHGKGFWVQFLRLLNRQAMFSDIAVAPTHSVQWYSIDCDRMQGLVTGQTVDAEPGPGGPERLSWLGWKA